MTEENDEIVISPDAKKKQKHIQKQITKAAKRAKRGKGFSEPFLKKAGSLLALLLMLVLVVNVLYIMKVKQDIASPSKETYVKPKLNVYVIQDPGCIGCADLTPIANSIRSRYDIEKDLVLDMDTNQAMALIEKFGIQRLPSIVVSGETDTVFLSDFEDNEGILIYQTDGIPYTDAVTGDVEGLVDAVILTDSSCEECSDLSTIIAQLRGLEVFFSDVETVESASERGQELIEEYDIEKVPTLLFSEDGMDYDVIAGAWPEIGTEEDDGTLVLRDTPPPYIDLASGEVKGLVTVTYLSDESCEECYDVTLHKEILTSGSFSVYIEDEITIDISTDEGQALLAKYDITVAPTVIISEEAQAYSYLMSAWETVGTVEPDGVLVFRDLEKLRGIVFKDLETGDLVDTSTGTSA